MPGSRPPQRSKSQLSALDMIALEQLTRVASVPWHSGAAVRVFSGNGKFKMWPQLRDWMMLNTQKVPWRASRRAEEAVYSDGF